MPKTMDQLRQELFGDERVIFEPDELPVLAGELEKLYNYLDSVHARPSELFERLLLLVQRENEVLNHPEFDADHRCPACGHR
jgi:hypothetical protein